MFKERDVAALGKAPSPDTSMEDGAIIAPFPRASEMGWVAAADPLLRPNIWLAASELISCLQMTKVVGRFRDDRKCALETLPPP